MTDRIKVIIKRPDEQIGHMTHIANTLKSLQNHVSGHIEVMTIGGGAVIIMNEEGKLRGLPSNFRVGLNFPDIIKGTVVVCGTDKDEFADVPFDIHFWQTLLTKWRN